MKTTPLGWCLSRQHTKCPRTVTMDVVQDPVDRRKKVELEALLCSCDCH